MYENMLIADEMLIITLLLIAIISSIILRHLHMPYTIGLVVIGYVFASFIVPKISMLSPLKGFIPESDLILYFFLPPLIFESAINLDTRLFRRNIIPILALAIVGVVVSAIIIGFLLSWFITIPLLYALLFGALISATDPVAVISIFKEIGAPSRLRVLLEGESLLNDASAIVIFELFLSLIGTSILKNNISVITFSKMFTSEVISAFVGGTVIGLLFGYILWTVIRKTPLSPHIHLTITLVGAYFSYIVSNFIFGFSGVITVVICGIITARASSEWIGPSKRDELTHFWEYIGFIANSLIFLLVGIAIASLQDFSSVIRDGILTIVILISIVIIARFIPVFGICGIYNIFNKNRIPLVYQFVSFWGGLRGAVAIALAISLPTGFPYRDAIIAFTTIIVVFTIVVQGLTISPLIKICGLGQSKLSGIFHRLHTDLIASRSATTSIIESDMSRIISSDLRKIHIDRNRSDTIEKEVNFENFWKEVKKAQDKIEIIRIFWLESLRFEKRQYRRLFDEGMITPSVYSDLIYIISVREELVQSGEYYSGYTDTPRSRFRDTMLVILNVIAPGSKLNKTLMDSKKIILLLGSCAVAATASDTIRFLQKLADEVCLSKDEISDIIIVYENIKRNSIDYIRSHDHSEKEILTGIEDFLALRASRAGIIKSLGDRLSDGSGDEKTITDVIDRLIKEKNDAGVDLLHSCRKNW